MNRSLHLSPIAGFLMAQGNEPVTGAAAAAAPAAPTGNGVTASGEPRKRAPATNKLDIARGRLPLLFVHSIRFKETATNAETAKKYATSVGKVFDIKKGRNFAYITEGYKPTAEDQKAAQTWAAEAAKHGGDKGGLEDVVASYKLATPEEAAKQNAEITAARSKNTPNAGAGKPADSTAAAGQGAAGNAAAGTAAKATPDAKKALVS